MDTVTWPLGPDAALGLANASHGPGAHYGRRARAGEPDHDHLVDASDARDFLAGHAIPAPDIAPDARQLARLRAARERARALVVLADRPDTTWRREMDDLLATVDYRLGSDGAIRSASTGWDGVIDDLLPAILALADERDRLRTCGNPQCRWLFVDRSRSGRRVWCEMAVCGNRMKVGRHRGRHGATRPISRPGTPSGPRG